MQTVEYNFKNIPVVPDSTHLTDIILSKTQRKTPTIVHPGYNITRIRRFYMRKIRFTYNSIEEKLGDIIKGFPKLEDIHPFYSDLINILYDKDHFKMALGYINTGKNLCEKVCKDYVKLMKYGDSLYRCKQLKTAALGRMVTILKKLNNSLKYLEEVRKHLGRLPNIDPFTRTLLLTGFPNVGKSSFMNKITNAESEVQPYPFTTQSLWAGHTYFKNVKWQVIDTPGILDRPLEERNTIEMQAINALAHLDAAVLYFIDISEECGYSLDDQLSLFNSIRPLFKAKPLIIVLNKIDLCPFENLPKKQQDELTRAAQENNTYLIKMSNVSNVGVIDVKSTACDILIEYRKANTNKTMKQGNNLEQFNNRIFVSEPQQRDNKKRPINIPNGIKERQMVEDENKKKPLNEVDEDTKLSNTMKYGEDEGHERKITFERVKEFMNKNGGDGVFYVPDREHFMLENPDWNDDIAPEIMDGKNVFDFIDPDIREKIAILEAEEEAIEQEILNKRKQKRNLNEMDLDEDMDDNDEDDDDMYDSDIDSELLAEHDQVMENQRKIRSLHKSVKSSTLPRKVRDLTGTERFMADLRTDKAEGTEKMQLLSNKLRNAEKDKTKNTLKRNFKIREEDIASSDDEGNNMDIDRQRTAEDKYKPHKLTKEEKLKKKKEEEYREIVAQRMKDKIQKKFNHKGIVNTADRAVGTKLPKHLNTGKRGIGKTDRR